MHVRGLQVRWISINGSVTEIKFCQVATRPTQLYMRFSKSNGAFFCMTTYFSSAIFPCFSLSSYLICILPLFSSAPFFWRSCTIRRNFSLRNLRDQYSDGLRCQSGLKTSWSYEDASSPKLAAEFRYSVLTPNYSEMCMLQGFRYLTALRVTSEPWFFD